MLGPHVKYGMLSSKHTLLLDPSIKFHCHIYKYVKILVAIGIYCVNCTKFGQLILRKISEIVTTVSDFKAEMHQIRFRLGLCPRPRWGSLQCSPRV